LNDVENFDSKWHGLVLEVDKSIGLFHVIRHDQHLVLFGHLSECLLLGLFLVEPVFVKGLLEKFETVLNAGIKKIIAVLLIIERRQRSMVVLRFK